MNHDWHDLSFARQQSQHQAHNQPLIGMDYSRSWMTWKEWAVCAVVIVGFVTWVIA